MRVPLLLRCACGKVELRMVNPRACKPRRCSECRRATTNACNRRAWRKKHPPLPPNPKNKRHGIRIDP